MKKITWNSACKRAFAAAILAAIMTGNSCRTAGRQASPAPLDAGTGLSIIRLEILSRDNPAAPWRPAQYKGGLIFNNDCTVRITCDMTLPKNALTDEIRQSVIVKHETAQIEFLYNQRLPVIITGQDTARTDYEFVFPCFQSAPAWLDYGDTVVVTVIVNLGMSVAGASVNLIYDLAE